MPINVAIVKKLVTVIAATLAVLVAALVASASGWAQMMPVAIIVGTSVLLFLALLWLWVLWLLYFKRSGQSREFWLCYCLPYAYALYRSLALLRSPTPDAA